MKVLLTGGCGFVGRRFAKRLLDRGDKVTIVDNLSTGKTPDTWMFKPESNKNAQFLFCDARTYFNTASAGWFDLVIHLAAVVGGRTNIEGDPLGVATDLSIDAEMFNWAVRGETMPKVLYFSSSAAYPIDLQRRDNNCLLTESIMSFDCDAIGKPDYTYGWAKLSGEYLAKYAVEKYGLNVNIYRPFGGYGEDQDLSYPFPAIIRRIVDGDDPVVVWGSGDQRRDFIAIEDVVSSVLTSMEHLAPGEAMNIGTGVGTSFHDLAALAGRVYGREFKIVADRSKPEGVYSRVADPSKMLQYYKPKISLEEGIEGVIDALTPI